MAGQTEVLRGLEEASQKQEKEIVLDLVPDRILHYVGVYIVLALAGITKIAELAGNNVSCYPANTTTGFDSEFISYIRAYCWESSDFFPDSVTCTGGESQCMSRNNSCKMQDYVSSEKKLLKNPALVKSFLQCIPYLMLLEAILFAIPSAWWHFRVGARLMGHLKFMKLLLNDIYESVKSLPTADYQRLPYDGDSNYLNAWRRFEPPETESAADQTSTTAPSGGGSNKNTQKGIGSTCAYKKRGSELRAADDGSSDVGDVKINVTGETNAEQLNSAEPPATETSKQPLLPQTAGAKIDPNGAATATDHAQKKATDEPAVDFAPADVRAKRTPQKPSEAVSSVNEPRPDILSRIFFGEMRDRHLFSMICFENFSSLEHHPYILSIFQLTEAPNKKDEPGNMPMKQGILRQMCHEDNFKGRFLIRSYILKHAFGILVSLAMLVTAFITLYQLGPDLWSSESFQCDVIYHEDLCVICTMHRKRDMIALFVVDVIIIAGYFFLSIGHLVFIRNGAKKASSFYFEDIRGTGSVAILAASN